jgi:hypothetical protein
VRWLFPGQEVQIETICLDCGEPITIRMNDREILSADPPTIVGYITSPFTRWREGSTPFN